MADSAALLNRWVWPTDRLHHIEADSGSVGSTQVLYKFTY